MTLLSGIRRLFSRPAPIPESSPAPRRVVAKYDAAQTGRDNSKHWSMADSLSAAAANSPEVRRILRTRARYEVANNSYASGMIQTLANDTIGTGPALQMLSGNDLADSQVEESFWSWMQAIGLPQKLRTMRMAKAVDGEAFLRLYYDGSINHPVKLGVRLYEADQIASPIGRSASVDGINLDQYGNPLSYLVLRKHPGDTGLIGSYGDAETVGASLMIHLFRADRPGQARGVPEITPALMLYPKLRRMTLAVLDAAETAANIAGLIQTQAVNGDPDEVEPLDTFDIERNTLMTLPKGWGLSQLRAEQPTTTYGMFKREIINEIARCLNMPYNVAAGDSSSYNYASGRLDHKVYYKSLRVDQSQIEAACLDRIFAEWWRVAVLLTRTDQADVLPPSLAEFDRMPAHEWRWDGDEHVDPLKEANAAVTLLEAGLLTEAEYHARRGKDWEDQQQQRARELGVSVAELQELTRKKLFSGGASPVTEPDPTEAE